MIQKEKLTKLYLKDKLSAKQISRVFNCSENKVHYWLSKYEIQKRSISEATYQRANPSGDPFNYKRPVTPNEYFLFGLGLGLFWGEGNKANTGSVRLGNTDPALVKYFIEFLVKIYNIDKNKLRFGIQIFTDTNPLEVRDFWCKRLSIKSSQFHKTTITKQGKVGSYGKKIQHGVLTVYFSNKKLRDMIVGAILELQNSRLPM